MRLQAIGHVESPLVDLDAAPKQADEGAPAAVLVFEESVRPALIGLSVGTPVVVLTWLDRARREVLAVHPRGDPSRQEVGVFSTRSPDRPNPIGLHPATVTLIDGVRVTVDHLEAVNGTPLLDMKPILQPIPDR
jgi:tRNA-Thr(GGU) m(6)t(6)A37 methyltransferase TsaA